MGGGIAGLSAAKRLKEAKIKTTLLEARKRFGGRILTIREGKQTFELGAEFVHGKNRALLSALAAANLKTSPVSDQNQAFEQGHLRPAEIWEEFGELTKKIDTKSPDISFLRFLKGQKGDESWRRMMIAFVEGFNAADANRISVHSLRRAEYSAEQMEGDVQARVELGYSALVDQMVDDARGKDVQLVNDSIVRHIRWEKNHVEVGTSTAGRTETFQGDAAVISLPLGVLKANDVKFHPAIPAKDEAIAGLAFGNVVKVVLHFRDAWWKSGDFGFIHALNEEIPTWWSDPRGPVLTGWSGGPRTDALSGRSKEELRAVSVGILSRIFSASPSVIEQQLVSCHYHDWAKDPYSRGAYSYIPVGGVFFPKQLGAPVDKTLFFAGEATAQDAQLGTVFAAIESGERAVSELLTA